MPLKVTLKAKGAGATPPPSSGGEPMFAVYPGAKESPTHSRVAIIENLARLLGFTVTSRRASHTRVVMLLASTEGQRRYHPLLPRVEAVCSNNTRNQCQIDSH